MNSKSPVTPKSPALGIARVAVGRVDGIGCFDGTVQSFLASLAPLLAFPLVAAVIMLMRDSWLGALSLMLVTLVAQLTPPVISHALARRWGREAAWLQYSTAYNWCYWALPVVAAILMVGIGVAIGAGLPPQAGSQAVVFGVGAYSLWLHWFLARHGLAMSRGRAALLVAIVNVGTLVLAIGPALLS